MSNDHTPEISKELFEQPLTHASSGHTIKMTSLLAVRRRWTFRLASAFGLRVPGHWFHTHISQSGSLSSRGKSH